MGARVRAHDPVGIEQARRELPDIDYCDDPYLCARGADVMVVVTEWSQFRALDLARLKKEMAGSVVIDLRNIYSPQEMEVCGFIYEGVGRGASALQFRSGRVRPDISNGSVDVLSGVPGSKMSESGQSRRFDGAPIKEADTQRNSRYVAKVPQMATVGCKPS